MSTRHPSYGYKPHDADRVDAIVTKFCQCPNCGTKTVPAQAPAPSPFRGGDAATGAAPTSQTHGTSEAGGGTIDDDWWLVEGEDDDPLPLTLIYMGWFLIALSWALAWVALR